MIKSKSLIIPMYRSSFNYSGIYASSAGNVQVKQGVIQFNNEQLFHGSQVVIVTPKTYLDYSFIRAVPRKFYIYFVRRFTYLSYTTLIIL